MKSYTDIEQSRKLAEILPIESADMWWNYYSVTTDFGTPQIIHLNTPWVGSFNWNDEPDNIPCWSLSALMELMNRNYYNVSLNCHGAEWNVKFDDSEEYKDFTKDYAVDAAFEMIVWLKENNRI